MKNKYFRTVCIVICVLAMTHESCYADADLETDNERNNIQQLSTFDKTMKDLFQFNSRYEKLRSLFLEKEKHFEDIKDYFLSNGSIKSFGFYTESESVSYADKISEMDYRRLKNNAQFIYSKKNNFEIGIDTNFIGGTLRESKTCKAIVFYLGNSIRREKNYLCLEYLSYENDSSEIKSNCGFNGLCKKKIIAHQWYFTQSGTEIKMRNDCLLEKNNLSSNDELLDKSLSYEKIKKLILEHTDVFENYIKLLRENNKYEFNYSNYENFKALDDEQSYKNFNVVFYNRKQYSDIVDESSHKEINLIPYCKETEKFIAFLKENNIVLPIGVSIEASFSEDETFQLKIFTRSKLVNDKCFNVTIAYDSADKQAETKPTIQENMPIWQSELTKPEPPKREIIPYWYYIEEMGSPGGLYQGE